MWLLLGLIWMLLWGGFGVYMAQQKGRSEGAGVVFGVLLGPLGLLLLALLPPPLKVQLPRQVYEFKPRKMLD